MKKAIAIIGTVAVLLIPACSRLQERPEPITTGTLYEEMSDLQRLTYFPDPAFRTIQFSSYDHRSRLAQGPDWFANSDGFGGEPVPNFERVLKEPDEQGIGEYLIADLPGPGAIVRLWSAAISGEIRLHLDGAQKPLFQGPALDFFHNTLDTFQEIEGLERERLETTVYQRDASYAPIPFARHMRLVWIGDLSTIHFYQVQVRLYEPQIQVVTFTPQDLVTYADIIDSVTQELSDPDRFLKQRSQATLQNFQTELGPGAKEDLVTWKGPQALEHLTLKLQAENIDLALRQTLLYIICDGHPWGQVQSPVGDFFGAAPGINPFRSLPFSVLPDGTMVCRFIMPFAENLIIRLENMGDQNVSVEGSALPYPEYEWNPESSLHFRARWRVEHDLVASNLDVQDLAFLVANGKGLYVGTTSILLNPNQVPTPSGNWWGEGDEKVFVDDEALPSIFGTGSEDYYNYSWSSPDIFAFPYCGQPRNDGPGNRGFVTNFRWHILDPIPFKRNIRFYMELYSHERTPGFSYARTAYHYARPGLTDDHRIIMPKDLRALELPENWQPAARRGARNSVMYPAEEILRERSGTGFRTGNLWAGGRILIWTPLKQGESKTFDLPIAEKGTYRIHITAALTPDSGRLSMQVDKESVSLRGKEKSIDLYRPFRRLLRNFAIQDLELDRGRHTLSLHFEGSQPDILVPEIGLDFIWVQKIEK